MIWIWDENINALRPAIAEDCTAEMAETHGIDPVELAKQLPGAKMERKKIEHPRNIKNDKRAKRELGKAKEIVQKAFEDSWFKHNLRSDGGGGIRYALIFDRDAFEARVKALLYIVEDDVADFIEEKLSGHLTESEWDRILASFESKSKGPIQ